MLLEEVRDEDKTNRLLFKVLIEEDSLIISAKARGNKGPTLINIEEIIGPYVDSITIKRIRKTCNSIYLKKKQGKVV